MSTRDDAVLTEAEREAFARLQAQVASDGSTFSSSRAWHLGGQLETAIERVGTVLSRTWFASLLVTVGVVAVVVGLLSSVAVAVVGLALIACGGIPLVELVAVKVEAALATHER